MILHTFLIVAYLNYLTLVGLLQGEHNVMRKSFERKLSSTSLSFPQHFCGEIEEKYFSKLFEAEIKPSNF